MKKCLFFAFLFGTAAMVQAATAIWGSGDLLKIGAPASVEAYYVVVEKSAYDIATSQSSEELYYAYKDQLTDPVTMNPLTGAADGKTDYDGNAAYAIAIYAYKSPWGGTYALAKAAVYVPSDADEDLPDLEASESGNLGGLAFIANGSSWAAVPEPATMSLLVLGLVAVGARRKVA